jgi:hypothetical protein
MAVGVLLLITILRKRHLEDLAAKPVAGTAS